MQYMLGKCLTSGLIACYFMNADCKKRLQSGPFDPTGVDWNSEYDVHAKRPPFWSGLFIACVKIYGQKLLFSESPNPIPIDQSTIWDNKFYRYTGMRPAHGSHPPSLDVEAFLHLQLYFQSGFQYNIILAKINTFGTYPIHSWHIREGKKSPNSKRRSQKRGSRSKI